MSFRRSIAGAVLGVCLLLAGCGGGGGGSDTVAQAPTPPGGLATGPDGTSPPQDVGTGAGQSPSPQTPDPSTPSGPAAGSPDPTPPTPPTPPAPPAPDPTAPPAGDPDPAEKLAALGEWSGSVWPSVAQMQIVVLDSGAALALRHVKGEPPTRVYMADLPKPPPLSFQLEVTAIDLSTATVSTETWSVGVPNENGFNVETAMREVMEMTRTHFAGGKPLMALPGDWTLELRTMGGRLGPWPVTIDGNGQFRYDNGAGCRATGRLKDVANSQEWVSLHIVFTQECSDVAGGNSFRGLLRRSPALDIGFGPTTPETLIGAAATGNKRNVVTVMGLRRSLP